MKLKLKKIIKKLKQAKKGELVATGNYINNDGSR